MQGKGSGIIILDNCSVAEKELICNIGKDIIEEYAIYNGQKFSMSYFIPDGEKKKIIFIQFWAFI